ncbi:unnamed protein product, partial [Brassica oleracea var. botrytis]
SPRLDLLDISSILASSLYNSSSHHHQQQQPLVNPEILELAASLFSQNQNQNFVMDHYSKTHDKKTSYHHDVNQTRVNQYQTNHHELQYCLPPFPNKAHINDMDHHGEHTFASNSNTSVQDCDIQSCNYYSSSNFIDHSFNFADSVLNTPSSSLATLNSSATTYINSSSCSTEDEIESYFSNFLKFDIPDFLDINGFII